MRSWPVRTPARFEPLSAGTSGSPASGLRIGILGGGQLGRMLGLAGIPLGFRFLFLDPAPDACAAVSGELLNAGFDDREAALELGRQVDVATFDFENVPESSARALADLCPLYPGANALGASQDRLVEKTLLVSLGARVPAYHAVSGRTDLLEGLERLGYPAVLKTRRFGYDGKGQAVLRDAEDLERAWQKLGDAPLILETFVPFEAECSLIGVRARDGDTRFWPLTGNVHADGILALSKPGGFDAGLQAAAERIMAGLMDHLGYVGVLTIEFFLHHGELLFNEFAPRVHNSGHWTIDGAECSQFENHLRAISGLALGATGMTAPSLMFNWIGQMPPLAGAMEIPGLHWHDYGKQARPGRKIGHATLTAPSDEALRERADRLAGIAGGKFPALLGKLFSEA
jgi:5-(carboxyamino)imidazole ribonucleotide synthase